jgi:hypothetical protein
MKVAEMLRFHEGEDKLKREGSCCASLLWSSLTRVR